MLTFHNYYIQTKIIKRAKRKELYISNNLVVKNISLREIFQSFNLFNMNLKHQLLNFIRSKHF